MATVLIVDDEKNVLYSLEKSLGRDGLDIVTAQTAREALESVRRLKFDAMLLDVNLPDMSGLDAYLEVRAIDPKLPVIIMTAHAKAETAIEAMKRGAFEYLLKPFDLGELKAALGKAIEVSRLTRVPAVFDPQEQGAGEADRIVGSTSAMQSVYKEIGRVAPQDVTVLILGETGTGKELVARSIYHHSRRANGPFLAINCAAIPETLLESELFGHEKGAFTGADRRRIGKFEQARGGTIFLDEIGDMTPATQAKVLRILQNGRFERVGGEETIETDVRVIAATNRDLENAITDQRFRADLFYRLNTFTIKLPPLRDRLEDIPRLVDHFIVKGNRKLGTNVRSISSEALDVLRKHDWPGNIRELESAVQFALVRARGDVITPDCLPPNVRAGATGVATAADGPTSAVDLRSFVRGLLKEGIPELYDRVHQTVDRTLLEEVLQYVDGNQVRASELLGISRTTLRARLQALGLVVEKTVRADANEPAGDLAAE